MGNSETLDSAGKSPKQSETKSEEKGTSAASNASLSGAVSQQLSAGGRSASAAAATAITTAVATCHQKEGQSEHDAEEGPLEDANRGKGKQVESPPPEAETIDSDVEPNLQPPEKLGDLAAMDGKDTAGEGDKDGGEKSDEATAKKVNMDSNGQQSTEDTPGEGDKGGEQGEGATVKKVNMDSNDHQSTEDAPEEGDKEGSEEGDEATVKKVNMDSNDHQSTEDAPGGGNKEGGEKGDEATVKKVDMDRDDHQSTEDAPGGGEKGDEATVKKVDIDSNDHQSTEDSPGGGDKEGGEKGDEATLKKVDVDRDDHQSAEDAPGGGDKEGGEKVDEATVKKVDMDSNGHQSADDAKNTVSQPVAPDTGDSNTENTSAGTDNATNSNAGKRKERGRDARKFDEKAPEITVKETPDSFEKKPVEEAAAMNPSKQADKTLATENLSCEGEAKVSGNNAASSAATTLEGSKPVTPKRAKIIIPTPPGEEDEAEAVTPVTTHVAAMLSTLKGNEADLMQEAIEGNKKRAARAKENDAFDGAGEKAPQQSLFFGWTLTTSDEKPRRKKIARKLFGSRDLAEAQRRARASREARALQRSQKRAASEIPAASGSSKKQKTVASKSTRKKSPVSNLRSTAREIWSGSPDENIEGGWPEGWTKKVFQRQGGASKGHTDRYWYTPKEKKKLRSMKEVTRFLGHLKDKGGDEKAAWAAFKGR